MSLQLVLASASPARAATLRRAGVEPVIVVSAVDEAAVTAHAHATFGDLPPPELALLLARTKCEDVAVRLQSGDLVVGADSLLEFDGDMYGKPASADEARARWLTLTGRSAVLHTGHWLIDARGDRSGSGGSLGATASTTVHFGDVDADEIDAYIATGEPLRVAGAFTVDGLGAPFIEGIEGDFHNVVGLSLPVLRMLLRDLGLNWRDLRG